MIVHETHQVSIKTSEPMLWMTRIILNYVIFLALSNSDFIFNFNFNPCVGVGTEDEVALDLLRVGEGAVVVPLKVVK